MGALSTHVLDTSIGKPANGMTVELYFLDDDNSRFIKSVITNADGRTDGSLIDEKDMAAGCYELVFFVGDYYRSSATLNSDSLFLEKVPVRFMVADIKQNYHVPLLVTPWSYSTYRGS